MIKNGKNLKCPWCKFETTSPKELENHLKGIHYISYQTASEITTLQNPGEEGICYKCRSPKTPLTFLLPDFFHIPCWSCLSTRERKVMVKMIIEEIREFYDKILSDKFLQLFLVDPIYYNATIPHTFDTFKSILSKKELPGRNEIWAIDWLRGTPKIISRDNLEGVEIKDLGAKYAVTSTKERITTSNRYIVHAPTIIGYDQVHHGRYNILNINSDRKTKRLRIPGTDTCYRFWNNEEDTPGEWKSILRVTKGNADNPEENWLDRLTPENYLTLKLAILRNKTFMRSIFQIISIILAQGVGIFRDKVFLGNTVDICSMDPRKKWVLNIAWRPGDIEVPVGNNIINISIL